MTAEVAILNKSAVVVAADSAVTVQRGKVHRFANKIFQICDAAPIGLMVYGQAEYCGLPWETLAKLFRMQHGSDNFKTVKECYEAFRIFIADPRFLTKDEAQKNLVLFTIGVMSQLLSSVKNTARKKLSAEIRSTIELQIKSYHQIGGTLRFQAPTLRQFRSTAADIVTTTANQIFEEIKYKIPTRLNSKLIELVWNALCAAFSSEYRAGVAVFGFGDDELLPAIVSEELDGSCYGGVRSIERKLKSITQKNDAALYPFADRSEMDVFMQGINRSTRLFMSALMKNTAEQIAERVINENFSVTSAQYKVIKAINDKAIAEMLDKSVKDASAWIRKESISPVLDVIRSLPKEDMAALAEALVEITALKTKVRSDIESVGGDVDVCVVTKGDGLIWIKRKEYFELNKNQQYLFKRYGKVRIL